MKRRVPLVSRQNLKEPCNLLQDFNGNKINLKIQHLHLESFYYRPDTLVRPRYEHKQPQQDDEAVFDPHEFGDASWLLGCGNQLDEGGKHQGQGCAAYRSHQRYDKPELRYRFSQHNWKERICMVKLTVVSNHCCLHRQFATLSQEQSCLPNRNHDGCSTASLKKSLRHNQHRTTL